MTKFLYVFGYHMRMSSLPRKRFSNDRAFLKKHGADVSVTFSPIIPTGFDSEIDEGWNMAISDKNPGALYISDCIGDFKN